MPHSGGRHVGPREECQIRPRVPFGVGIKQVVCAWIILVDAALHQAHTKDSRVKIEVFLRRAGDGGDVVESVH